MTDLTQNTAPLGLMSKEDYDELFRLRNEGRGVEMYVGGGWQEVPADTDTYRQAFSDLRVYRIKKMQTRKYRLIITKRGDGSDKKVELYVNGDKTPVFGAEQEYSMRDDFTGELFSAKDEIHTITTVFEVPE